MTTRILSTLVVVFFSANVFAQTKQPLAELELEDLMKIDVQSVFGASKFLQKVTDAPAAVSVVTAKDIELYGYRTLADIIRSAPGFNVTYDRNYTYVGVRGFQRPGDYNSRVLVTVDGHRINDPIYNMAYVGTELPLDVELIDRVELIRGPSSSIYGTNAFFAVINVVMKKGQALSGLQLSGDAGSLQTARGRGAFGVTSANGLDVLLSGSRYRSSGQRRLYFQEYDAPATNNGIAENLDGDNDYKLFGSLSYQGLSFQGVYGSRQKSVPTASFGSWFNDPRFKTSDSQGWVDLRYVRDVPGNWQLTGRAYFDHQRYSGLYPSNSSETDEPSISLFGDYARSNGWGTEIDLARTFARRHKVTAGGEYRDNFRLNQGGFDVATGDVFLDDRRTAHDSALFVEDQYTVHDKLLLNAGIRSDRYYGFGSTTNPRLALIFKPVEKTAIKVLWGTAFRAPDAYELYYRTDLLLANPDLKPETIRTTELVVERYFSDQYRVMADVYTSHVRGLISQVVNPEGFFVFMNLNSAATHGVEAEFEGKWRSGVSSRFSYSYQNASDLATDKPLVNTARHLATVNVMVPLVHRQLFAGMDLHYVGRVETLNGSSTNGFVVPNLTVTTRDFRNGVTMAANVYNLFDNNYGYPGGDEHRQNILYQDGRTFRVSFSYAWRMDK